MKILFIYNATQTYTNTVYEHVAAFQKYSAHETYFAHHDGFSDLGISFDWFDAVIIHYTIRLPYDQISSSVSKRLAKYRGLKALFIQDEYDFTYRAWGWIKKLAIDLVFTVVPDKNISIVYPKEHFPGVRFVSVLTGYVPENIPMSTKSIPPSQRGIVVGYRGRPLSIRYGQLGRDKIEIGSMVKTYCQENHIPHDIAWAEEERVYGPKWYEFVSSCKSMLGSESGSNVFDWDGKLDKQIEKFKKKNPQASDEEVYANLIKVKETPGLMNQVSPRVFESIMLRTAMVLFEGNYSGIIEPYKHYIPLKKDGSNLAEVMSLLRENQYVDDIVERAYKDIIDSNKCSYQHLVASFDAQIKAQSVKKSPSPSMTDIQLAVVSQKIGTYPKRHKPPVISSEVVTIVSSVDHLSYFTQLLVTKLFGLWAKLPVNIRKKMKPYLVFAYHKSYSLYSLLRKRIRKA